MPGDMKGVDGICPKLAMESFRGKILNVIAEVKPGLASR